MKALKNRLNWLLPATLALGSFLFFQLFYSYHLFFKEQTQLFLFTPDYILSYFQKPGWLAAMSGDFLTQFFYLRGGGPIVLALLFLLEWWLMKQVLFKITASKTVALWALIPVVADLTAYLALLYTPRSTMGIIFILIAFLLITSTSYKSWTTFLLLLLSACGHWLFGSAVFVLPFLLLFSKNIYRPFIISELSILLIVASVYIGRPHYLLPVSDTFLFPLISVKGLFPLLTFSLVIFLSVLLIQKETFQSLSKWIALIILPIVLFFGFKMNANFGLEKILALDSETYFGHNQRVLKLAEKWKIKNRVATYYTNMALAKKGVLPDRLLEFYQPSIHGLILPVSQYENWQTIFFSNELFYLLGDMNLAQHSAMLGNTFSPYNRSSRMMKRLAEINMVIGDYDGAEKFLKMLDKTLFHKKWADEKMKENRTDAKSEWLDQKRTQIAQTDTIRTAFDYIKSIEFLVEQNPPNKIALDYLLCYHLLNKDLTAFRKAYDRYAKPQNKFVPKVYAQALLIELFRERASEETIQKYKIDNTQIRDFLNYTSSFEAEKGNVETMQEKFGNTYWFYFHFATMKEGEE